MDRCVTPVPSFFGGRVNQTIQELRNQILQDLGKIKTTAELNELEVKYLGKKGPIQGL